MRKFGARIRFREAGPELGPGVSTPFSLQLLIIPCVLSLVATLLAGLAITLSESSQPDLLPGMAVALIYFAFPICICVAIVTDSALSRPLIMVTAIGIAGHAYRNAVLDPGRLSADVVGTIGLLVLCSITAWLYGSRTLRYYYAVLKGRAIAASEIPDAPTEGQQKRVRRAGRVAYWLTAHAEWLVFAIVALAIFIMVFTKAR